MTIATLETKRDLAIAAQEAGDYATAIKYALSAKLLLATSPNVNQAAGGGSRALSWNAQAIDTFIGECKQLQTAATTAASGIRRSRVTYERDTDSGAFV